MLPLSSQLAADNLCVISVLYGLHPGMRPELKPCRLYISLCIEVPILPVIRLGLEVCICACLLVNGSSPSEVIVHIRHVRGVCHRQFWGCLRSAAGCESPGGLNRQRCNLNSMSVVDPARCRFAWYTFQSTDHSTHRGGCDFHIRQSCHLL